MINFLYTHCGNGGTGRRSRLRTCRAQALGGSNPSSRTITYMVICRGCQSGQSEFRSFRKKQRQKRRYKKCRGQQRESRADTVMQRQGPDSKRCEGGKSTANVVAKPHGRRADFGREYFASDGSVAGEKSSSKKSNEWAEQ